MKKTLLLLLFLGHLIIDMSQGSFPVVVAKQKEAFQLSFFQVGLMMTALHLTSSVIQPCFGYLADRLSDRLIIPAGVLWTALSMGVLGWAPNYASALLLVSMAGLGSAAFHPSAMMSTYLNSGTRRGLGAAVFSTAGSLGYAIGPMAGSFLITGYGLHATIWLIPLGCVFCIAFLFSRSAWELQDPKTGTAATQQNDANAPSPRWGAVLAICFIVMMRSWVYVSIITYLPIFFKQKNMDLDQGSLVLTVFLFSGVLGSIYGGHLSDKFGRKSVIVCTMVLFTIPALLLFTVSGVLIWCFAAASGAALLASLSVTIVLTQELLPRQPGLASGLVLGLSFGIGGLGTALTGLLADMLGLTATLWILAWVPPASVILVKFIQIPNLVCKYSG
jgi:FSR family fosmidomycin resistance protein-like MFS transporter